MKWTDKEPFEEGWYWIRAKNLTARVVKVHFITDTMVHPFKRELVSLNPIQYYGPFQYAGPIERPEE